MNTETVIETAMEPVIELLHCAGLEFEVVYDGSPSGCPACSSKELMAAA